MTAGVTWTSMRFVDEDKTLTLSVRDLVEAGPPSGHLLLEVAQSRMARLALGRAVHTTLQGERQEEDASYRAEVSVTRTLEIEGWRVRLQGRVDGLTEESGRTIVEEIKSTALDADRLYATEAMHWPAYTAQLEIYLWMLAEAQHADPSGRLVLVSVLDGARHVLGVPLDRDRVGTFIRKQGARLVQDRERRIARMTLRRGWKVPTPFSSWRPGQQAISDAVVEALAEGRRLLVQAPTGLGKTGAILHGALAWSMRNDRFLFWATSRNTQQPGVLATLDRFRRQGLPLVAVGLRAKERVCLNEVLSCRPDACRFAHAYYDKIDEAELVDAALADGGLQPDTAMDLGRKHEVCPYQLALDVAEHADVVVGDVNYATSPHGRLARLFSEGRAAERVLVVDEAHQLVDRARDHASPRIEARLARKARDHLTSREAEGHEPFLELAESVLDTLLDTADATPGPFQDGQAPGELALGPYKALAEGIDALGLDYALLNAQSGGSGSDDPWVELGRRVLRFSAVAEDAGPETLALVDVRTGREEVRLLCLDPSTWLGPRLAELGGFVGCSATLSPPEFHRDLLGLPEDTIFIDVPSPFPTHHRAVLICPGVSTTWRDRSAHAEPTAALLSGGVHATPGNVAIYFPSFAMLDDICDRLVLDRHTLMRQTRGMDEQARADWLQSLIRPDPVVMAAVLGGVFAEGIDLPPGALSSLFIVGPALPPMGLERDLLRQYFEERFGRGFAYASLVPGMTRVVQAAGRLIRRPEDTGVIALIGRRFQWRDHAELLPDRWQPRVSQDLAEDLRAFWQDRCPDAPDEL